MMALSAPIDQNYSKLNYTAMKHFNLLKTTLLLCALIVGSLSSWAEKITDYTKIVSGTKYYIGATVGGTDYYFFANGSSTSSSVSGTGKTNKAEACIFVFEGCDNEWTVKFDDSGYYLSLKNSKDNAKVVVQEDAATWTLSNVSSRIQMKINDYLLQKNSGSSLNFGSYSSGQTNVWLEVASSDPSVEVSKTSLDFGTIVIDDTKDLTFDVTPSNLTHNLTVASNNSKYTVNVSEIANNASKITVTVTAAPTAIGDNMLGKIIISCSDLDDDIEINLTSTVIRKSPALAFDPTSISLTRGESFTAPSFSKDAGIPFSSISFSSSYNDVATVSDEGVISLGTSTGTAIIKANFEQTDVYAAGTATCTITVNPAGVTPEPNAAGYYQKVTDTKDITDGKYLIVYETDNVAFDGSRATLDAGENTKSISIKDDKVDSDDDVDAISFTLAAYDGGFSIQSASGKYIGRSAASNGMDVNDKQTKNLISISNGNAIIEGVGGYQLRFNSATGTSNYRFRYYAGDKQKAVQLYKYVAGAAPSKIDIYVSAAGYSTYASNFDLDFTSVTGLKAYIAKENSGIKMEQVNKVPKGTGILLRATDGGDKPYSVPTATTTDDVTGNLFVRGNDEAVASENGSNHNYILNVVNNQLGFYKAYGNTVAKNRAYLQTTVAASRINLNFDEETTGIAEVKTNVKSDLFNINGQRVEKTAKGLYIMNGKKFIVK